jgi:hypothetical protein
MPSYFFVLKTEQLVFLTCRATPGAQKFVNVSLKIQLGIPRPLRQLMLDISPHAKLFQVQEIAWLKILSR